MRISKSMMTWKTRRVRVTSLKGITRRSRRKSQRKRKGKNIRGKVMPILKQVYKLTNLQRNNMMLAKQQ